MCYIQWRRYGTRSRSGDCCRNGKFGRVVLSFFPSRLSLSLSLSFLSFGQIIARVLIIPVLSVLYDSRQSDRFADVRGNPAVCRAGRTCRGSSPRDNRNCPRLFIESGGDSRQRAHSSLSIVRKPVIDYVDASVRHIGVRPAHPDRRLADDERNLRRSTVSLRHDFIRQRRVPHSCRSRPRFPEGSAARIHCETREFRALKSNTRRVVRDSARSMR